MNRNKYDLLILLVSQEISRAFNKLIVNQLLAINRSHVPIIESHH